MALLLINGEPVAARSGAQMAVVNPANEEVVDTVPKAGPEDVAAAVVFLLSERLAGHVSGAILPVAGGMEGRLLHPVRG